MISGKIPIHISLSPNRQLFTEREERGGGEGGGEGGERPTRNVFKSGSHVTLNVSDPLEGPGDEISRGNGIFIRAKASG